MFVLTYLLLRGVCRTLQLLFAGDVANDSKREELHDYSIPRRIL